MTGIIYRNWLTSGKFNSTLGSARLCALHGDVDTRSNRMSEYCMGNRKLDFCDLGRDLAVSMSSDLKFASQSNQACAKANRMLGITKRTFVITSAVQELISR